jgi:hypothetical protein
MSATNEIIDVHDAAVSLDTSVFVPMSVFCNYDIYLYDHQSRFRLADIFSFLRSAADYCPHQKIAS